MQFTDPKTYYKNLPQKRMAVGALIFNEQGKILILKTSYRKYWTIPGGVVEHNESLLAALIREVKEETNLAFINPKLAALDYCQAKIVNGIQNTESVQVLFDCGIINPATELSIKIDGEEIIEFKFCEIAEALTILGILIRKRIKSYLEGKVIVYLENGLKI